jgi:S1-C subfamily serine protease
MRPSDFAKMAEIYGGLPLFASLPGSAAERAGLRRGDIVISVNGLPTPDMDAFVRARSVRDDLAVVRYVRDGVEREAVLSWTEA